MAAILGNSVAVAVAVAMRTRPRAILLAMITMRKSTHEFPFLSYMSMGGAPLLFRDYSKVVITFK